MRQRAISESIWAYILRRSVECGDLRKTSFEDVWNNSRVFKDLRALDNYKGKCGLCEYLRICGGCRARAFEMTGDFMAEEPYCIHIPGKMEVEPN